MPKSHHNDFLPLPSVKMLRECFDYSPKTGELRWRKRPAKHFISELRCAYWNRRFAGTIAGMIAARSIRVRVDGIRYRAHRLIIKMTTGRNPFDTIDHKGGNPFDNRRKNLRIATMGQQSWNRKLPITNTSGYKGVYWHKKRKAWVANLTHKGVMHYLGKFDAAQEAAAAYEKKACELRPNFHRQSPPV